MSCSDELAVHLCPLLRAEGGCETCERIVLLLVFIRNNNMATNLQGSRHVAGNRRFASCDC